MLKKSPSQAELNQLTQLFNSGDYHSAENMSATLSKIYPKTVFLWKILGVALASQGKIAEAIPSFKKAITLAPKDAENHRNLANALNVLNQTKTAEIHFRKSISLNPEGLSAYLPLTKILINQLKFSEAEKECRKALTFKYSMAEIHNQLGMALLHQKNLSEAEKSFKTAIMIDPKSVEAYSNLSILLHSQGKQSEAKDLLEQILEIDPHWSIALNNMGNVLKELGEIESALEFYQKAFAQDHTMTLAYSNYLLIAGYYATLPLSQLLNTAKLFGKHISENIKTTYKSWLSEHTDATAHHKIRVGFVSGDFRQHAVMFFLEGLLRNIDQSQFELIAYSNHHYEDDVTSRIKPYFIKWQPIFNKNDQAAAEIIYQDNIHILFDLSGHTAHNRLPVFAYKPAPIQVTWAGYPATTGLAEMDYILADQFLVPIGQEQQFVEQVWRFPEVSGCFAPLIEDIPVDELPAIKNGYITFGCLNNLIKMNDDVVAVWSQVLHAVPNSKLFLQATPLSEPSVLQKTYDRYAAHGIAPERLILEGKTPRLDYFKSYNKIDIALDPFPCPGGTTTADTLWMSVPVLTLKGHNYWSRFGEAIANYVGQTEWVAEDTDDYVRKAALFAADIELLKDMRKTLRAKVLASPLFDAPRFTRNFESVLKGMVEKWKQDNQ